MKRVQDYDYAISKSLQILQPLDIARMAVISNRAITLSDSLKNTVDTQDSTSKTQMY